MARTARVVRRIDGCPRPFLKWAGGKAQLLDQLLGLIPNEWWRPRRIHRYHEPFLGGGALYLALVRAWGSRLIAHVADSNPELVDAWTGVLMDPLAVRAWLDSQGTTEADYYRVRAMKPESLESKAERAARTIYLNKAGFNGLYRTGPDFMSPQAKAFNVPWGKDERVGLYEPANLSAFKNWPGRMPTIHARECWECEGEVKKGDLVYLDPPYVPVTRTSKTDYGFGDFRYDEHERLAQMFERLVKRGAFVMLSNSDTPWVLDRYRDFEVHRVTANRAINRDGTKRRGAREVIVVGGR